VLLTILEFILSWAAGAARLIVLSVTIIIGIEKDLWIVS
jgi:hypothetical protein